MLFALMPAADVQFTGNWDVLGLAEHRELGLLDRRRVGAGERDLRLLRAGAAAGERDVRARRDGPHVGRPRRASRSVSCGARSTSSPRSRGEAADGIVGRAARQRAVPHRARQPRIAGPVRGVVGARAVRGRGAHRARDRIGRPDRGAAGPPGDGARDPGRRRRRAARVPPRRYRRAARRPAADVLPRHPRRDRSTSSPASSRASSSGDSCWA